MSFGAGLMGSMLNYIGGQETNAQNMDINNSNRDWQTWMSSSAMVRRVQDLKAAGLNPILATGTPGASMGSMSPIGMQNPAAGVGGTAAAFSQAALNDAQKDNIDADTDKKKADARYTRWLTGDQAVPLKDDGSPDWDRAGGGVMGNYSAQNAWQTNQNLKATYDNIVASTKKTQTDTDLGEIQKSINGLSLDQQKRLYDTVIRKAGADMGIAEANAKDAEAVAKITGNPTWGPIIKLFRMLVPGGFR